MYVKVRVRAGAKNEEFQEKSKTLFAVSVKEKPLQNLANRRVCQLVALHFKIPAGKVRIVSGHHSPSKILSIDIEES